MLARYVTIRRDIRKKDRFGLVARLLHEQVTQRCVRRSDAEMIAVRYELGEGEGDHVRHVEIRRISKRRGRISSFPRARNYVAQKIEKKERERERERNILTVRDRREERRWRAGTKFASVERRSTDRRIGRGLLWGLSIFHSAVHFRTVTERQPEANEGQLDAQLTVRV